jgi:hypothetical protein
MLALARMAYAVGDRQTYAASVYWYGRELVHNAVKNGGFNEWQRQFHPWHPHWDAPLETATDIWGTNAGWQGGGLVTAETGENQWTNFETRYDDVDTIRFDRDHALALARACVAWADIHETPPWADSMLYFYRVVLLGQDPTAAWAAWRKHDPTKVPPDSYISHVAIAEKEFPLTLQTLIPASTPPIADVSGWASQQMGHASFGLVSQSQMTAGNLPTPQWFAWHPPVVRPEVDWGDKWTFGSIVPANNPVPCKVSEQKVSAETILWSFALRPSTALDLFPEPLRTLAATSRLPDAELRKLAGVWESQATIPVLVAGPFANPGGGPNTAIAHGPERAYLAGQITVNAVYQDDAAQADPADKDAFAAGGKPSWKKLALSQGMLDLQHVWPQAEGRTNMACYLALWIRSPAAMPAMLGVGSDDGIAIWLNGTKVHDLGTARGPAFDQDRVAVGLKAGWNTVLMKITQSGGGWAAVFRVAMPNGLPIPGLAFSASPP